jgi:two-component system, chemotaxis family, response regulator Rcp1
MLERLYRIPKSNDRTVMISSDRPQPVRILIAEDNPGDVRLIQEVLRESKIANDVDVTRDGIETLEFLHQTGPYAHAARPGLILLDLSMPRKDGREVLAELKADPNLRRIPIVIMTSSAGEEDVIRAYDNHANCYVRKPVDFEQLRTVVRKIESFWFTIVTLPDR